ncbi:hypothetical protein D5b_00404 [Faustovirus]|nr:hypothetical protein D5b_00404 [Faustovirus]AMN84511.1 hypothetical protein D6_00101 [Faustovirus]AMP44347.1 hypothetical protein PRJ_Dakar_00395 [Faustovirus]
MGNEASLRKQLVRNMARPVEYAFQGTNHGVNHLGNSAYKVNLFIDTTISGYADKVVTCCDVRLTKLSHNIYDHNYTTKNLEIIALNTNLITPHICAECGDWKTYYKKCI